MSSRREETTPKAHPWALQKILGKDFWHMIEPHIWVEPEENKGKSLRNVAFLLLIPVPKSMPEQLDFRYMEKNLEQIKLPPVAPFALYFIRYSGGGFTTTRKSAANDPAYKQWIQKYADRFFGFWLPEWDNDFDMSLGISSGKELPAWVLRGAGIRTRGKPSLIKTKKQVYHLLEHEYKLMRDVLFGRVYGMHCGWPWDHYNLEWGGNLNCIEITPYGNPCHQSQIAFARGAARQYGKPWGTYIALFLGAAYPDYSYSRSYAKRLFNKRMKEVKEHGKSKTYIQGPDCGASVSLNKRMMFVSYISGANFVDHESQEGAFVMKKGKDFTWSPHGIVRREWLDFVRRKPDRGIPYTPVGILLDYYHGWTPSCPLVWYKFKPQRTDKMITAFICSVFPWNQTFAEKDNRCLANGPLGDIFDVLLPNPPSGTISLDVLVAYPVLLLLGKLSLDKQLARKLGDYVSNGGTVIVNSVHIGEYFNSDFLGGNLRKCSIYGRGYRCLFDCEPSSDSSYDFDEFITTKAKPLVVSQDGYVLAAENKFRKGSVILTTPKYLLDRKNRLLPFVIPLLKRIISPFMPFRVEGDIEYLFNQKEDGWWVSLINNRGIFKHPIEPQVVDSSKESTVRIFCKTHWENIVELTTGKEIPVNKLNTESMIECSVPPGEVRIVEFRKLMK